MTPRETQKAPSHFRWEPCYAGDFGVMATGAPNEQSPDESVQQTDVKYTGLQGTLRDSRVAVHKLARRNSNGANIFRQRK